MILIDIWLNSGLSPLAKVERNFSAFRSDPSQPLTKAQLEHAYEVIRSMVGSIMNCVDVMEPAAWNQRVAELSRMAPQFPNPNDAYYGRQVMSAVCDLPSLMQ